MVTRYFEAMGQKMTVKLELVLPALYAMLRELKTELREITKREYDKLTKEYSGIQEREK
jgi:hypothetical protein